jgi:hypothetical protein
MERSDLDSRYVPIPPQEAQVRLWDPDLRNFSDPDECIQGIGHERPLATPPPKIDHLSLGQQ